MARSRILVVVNKTWEVGPLVAVLLEAKAVPSGFPKAEELYFPTPGAKTLADLGDPRPRMLLSFADTAVVEIWCIQDWMDPKVSSSSSLEKMRVLPLIFSWQKSAAPDLVIAFGTAGTPTNACTNGCTVIGAQVFSHDPFKEDTTNPAFWHSEKTEALLIPTLDPTFFSPKAGIIDDTVRAQTEIRFLVPPVNAGDKQLVLAAFNNTAVGVVNITNYDDYTWADLEALEAFRTACAPMQKKPASSSIETTHGLIRLQSESPFLFVSGITDTEGLFNYEVGSRSYSQNFVAAHNAGIVVAWLLPRIVTFLPPKP